MTIAAARTQINPDSPTRNRLNLGVATTLAWREVRARPWRTLGIAAMFTLVLTLLLLNTASYYAVNRSYITHQTNWGKTALALPVKAESVADSQRELNRFADAVPDGIPKLVVTSFSLPVRFADAPGKPTWLSVGHVDLSHPFMGEHNELAAGRLPTKDGEAVISGYFAEQRSLSVGDTLELTRPAQSIEVVGIAQGPGLFSFWRSDLPWDIVGPSFNTDGVVESALTQGGGSSALLIGDAVSRLDDQHALVHKLSSVPEFSDAVANYTQSIEVYEHPALETKEVREIASASAFLFNLRPESHRYEHQMDGLDQILPPLLPIMFALGVVASVGFAVVGNRQVRTLGQLNAAGFSPRTLNAMMAMQGFWTGLVGVVAAVGITLILAKFNRSVLGGGSFGEQTWVLWGLMIVIALVTAMIAASLPGRRLIRQSTLTSLAGHARPERAPIWYGPVGLIALIIGIASFSSSTTLTQVVGTAVGMAGFLLICHAVVDLVFSGGDHFGGITRFAARDLGRHRTRSAAVVAAIGGALAILVMWYTPIHFGGNYSMPDASSVQQRISIVPKRAPLPPDVLAEMKMHGEPAEVGGPVTPQDLARVDGMLGTQTWMPVQQGTVATASSAYVEDRPVPPQLGATPTAAPPAGRETYELYVVGTTDFLMAQGLSADDAAKALDAAPIRVWGGPDTRLVDEGEPARLALQVQGYWQANWLLSEPPANPTSQYTAWVAFPDSLDTELFASASALAEEATYYTDEAGTAFDINFTHQEQYGSSPLPPWVGQALRYVLFMIPIAIVALFGIGLSLAETKRDRTVIFAAGGSPRGLRRIAATQAWLLTFCAGLIGYPVALVMRVVNVVRYDSMGSWMVDHAIGSGVLTLVVFPLGVAGIVWLFTGRSLTKRPWVHPDRDIDAATA